MDSQVLENLVQPIAMLEAANMKISMSRTGNTYDNAHMESFF